jgi:translation initiation factor 2B subunit (eIF-2B alpha/beta/delta family)
MPDEISLILNDRESGSVALLTRLMDALDKELNGTDLNAKTFRKLLITLCKKLHHFAAIENFLASLILYTGHKVAFPGDAQQFIRDYRLYWQDSPGKIAKNFLQHCNPAGKTILTHSHSETVISLLGQMYNRQVPFRVFQTLSSPGEEGKRSHERMRQLKLQAVLIDDANVKEALMNTNLILVGCDALLSREFLNKVGTRAILEQAKQFNVFSALVTESRKEIIRPGWKKDLIDQHLFEWVPLELIDRVVTEKRI